MFFINSLSHVMNRKNALKNITNLNRIHSFRKNQKRQFKHLKIEQKTDRKN